jgi:hypothetical protein
VRTVALGGLSQQFKAHALQLAAAAGGLQEVLDPPPADVAGKAHLAQDGCSGEPVFLVYATVSSSSSSYIGLFVRGCLMRRLAYELMAASSWVAGNAMAWCKSGVVACQQIQVRGVL